MRKQTQADILVEQTQYEMDLAGEWEEKLDNWCNKSIMELSLTNQKYAYNRTNVQPRKNASNKAIRADELPRQRKVRAGRK